ncbi:efflux RND transporter periplasmic adaptor subunit [Dechloromonas sp. CZR5]|uniref:efflux RND transporter periplasmic adaptor subunit n=1 Tax=Dechloromonas sp. CZR5 TaxID=2608630 RepID=UPI00123D8990|nr:efflux RND transporter periplasmic adaptor subunit [Dechloromonas sp. CZR5]
MKKTMIALLSAAVLAGCGEEKSAPANQAAHDPLSVKPAPELVSQLKTAVVGTESVAEMLRVAGSVEFDEQRVARIGASVTGRVVEVDVLPGQVVQKGELLARLNSSELASQQLAYLKARAQLELNRRAAERAKALLAADVIGSAELQRRESEYQISVAETRAAADQLRLLGFSEAAINRLGVQGAVDSVTPVSASRSGVVVERRVAMGQVVQPADTLFVVADLSRVWAVAQVPEQQVGQVRVGQSVSIEVPALGNESRVGKLIFVGQTVDPEMRTVLVRTELENRDGALKPAMLTSMLIAARPSEKLVVPASAVVREGDDENVFVAVEDGSYRLVKVKLAPEQGGRRVVLSGLKGGEKLVIEGAFHLNNERNRQAAEGS